MDGEEHGRHWRCYGSTTVSGRGQIVIPAEARRKIGLQPGDRLLVFDMPGQRGLTLVKVEVMAQFLRRAVQHLSEVEGLLGGEDREK